MKITIWSKALSDPPHTWHVIWRNQIRIRDFNVYPTVTSDSQLVAAVEHNALEKWALEVFTDEKK